MITVIIPIYNVEKYISKCMESLINQTYTNFEVLLINDGTKDNSIEETKKIIKDDSRFKIINKENGGQGSARNLGLKKAKGEYICFIDPDDFVEKDYLKLMINKIEKENVDICITNFNMVDERGKIIKIIKNKYQGSHSSNQRLGDFLVSINFEVSPCNKIYKKKCLKNIFFDEELYYEDFDLMYKIIYNTKKIYFCDEILYNYVQRNDSTSRGINKKKIKDKEKILKNMKEFLIEKKLYEKEKKNYIKSYLLNVILSNSYQILKYSDSPLDKIKKYLKNKRIKKMFIYKNIFIFKDFKHLFILILLKQNPYLFGKILELRDKKKYL